MKIFGILLLMTVSVTAQVLKTVPPRDLWREIDGVTNCIKGPGWMDFYFPTVENQFNLNGRKSPLAPGWYEYWGTVIEVQPHGVRVRGGSTYYGYASDGIVFFVQDYPYQAEEGSYITWDAAKESGVYTYGTVLGGTSTIHKFVYGHVCSDPVVPAPTIEELRAAERAAKKKKDELAAKALKYDEDLAAAGDTYGELRMGQRYRDGDGVERDFGKAREWFARAADQGDKTAAKELASLPEK